MPRKVEKTVENPRKNLSVDDRAELQRQLQEAQRQNQIQNQQIMAQQERILAIEQERDQARMDQQRYEQQSQRRQTTSERRQDMTAIPDYYSEMYSRVITKSEIKIYHGSIGC